MILLLFMFMISIVISEDIVIVYVYDLISDIGCRHTLRHVCSSASHLTTFKKSKVKHIFFWFSWHFQISKIRDYQINMMKVFSFGLFNLTKVFRFFKGSRKKITS